MGKLRQRDDGYCGIRYSVLPDQKRELISELTAHGRSKLTGSKIKDIAVKHKLSAKVIHSIATENNIAILPDTKPKSKPSVAVEKAPPKPAPVSKHPRSIRKPDDLDSLAELERQLRDEYETKLAEMTAEHEAFREEIKRQRTKLKSSKEQLHDQKIAIAEQTKTAENAMMQSVEHRRRTVSERKLLEDLRASLSASQRKFLKSESERVALTDDNRQLRRICDTLLHSLKLSEEDNYRLFMRLNQESVAEAIARIPDLESEEDETEAMETEREDA